jgi:3-phosphoglycerate kinase
MENSLKIVFEELKETMPDNQLAFMPDSEIADFQTKKENEEFQDGGIYLLENLNFKPHEHSYVEPEAPPSEPEPSEEEKKRAEEEAAL